AWPQGSVRYLYGGHFLDYLARRFGEEALRQVSYDYGGRFIPFAMNASIESAIGFTYPELYDDFLTELRREVGAQRDEIERLGRLEGVQLTERGQEIGPARIGRDGTVYFVESAVGEHTVLKAMAPHRSERTIGRVLSGAQLALHPDGRHAVVAQVEVHDVYRTFGDLFWIDLDDGAGVQISHGARARDPDIAADGSRVVFAQNDGVHSVVRSSRLGDITAVETLADLGPGTQVWSPRFSPDGESVVFAGFRDGRRDIYRVDIESQRVANLTADQAVDGAPVFSPDGAWVYFHSDRDGVFNLYAVASGGGVVRRLTRVVGGAFQPEPTPEGDALVYRTYGTKGFDLARLSLNDALDDTGDWPPWVPPDEEPARIVRQRAEVYPVRSYTVGSTILPRVWLPVLSVDSRGGTYGAGVFGEDAVGLHAYSVSAWYGVTSEFPGFSLWYTNRQFHPGLFVTLNRRLGFAMLPYVRNGRPVGVEEEIWSGRIGAAWPLLARRESNLSLTTTYEMTFRRGTRPLPMEPLDRTPRFPDQGRFGALRLRLTYGNLRSYLASISTEEGTRVAATLRLEDPWLGSSFTAVSVSVALTQFLRVPYHPRHVLAADLSFRVGKSNYSRRKLFGIGGLPRRDLILEIIAGRFGSAGALRGFPQTPFLIGDAIAVGHLEYRMPLVDVESGLQTLPIYFRTLHAAMFVDGAAVGDTASDLAGNQHYSLGLELRMSLVLAYGL
ncbi:MAG: hypothetical protein V3T05_13155, partial [Myxococcota bacterium]